MLKSAVIEEKKYKHSPWTGADNPLGPKFWCQQECLITMVICCKFEKNFFDLLPLTLNTFFSWFNKCIHIAYFHDFIHVYGPEAGADNALGMKFWCQQEHLVTSVNCCKFKKISFEVWFFTYFFMILYMYVAPGQGQTDPRWQSFDVNRNVFSLHSFVASFKKNVFEVWFYHDLIHVYSPRAGADSPQGTKFWCQQKSLITLPICCKFHRNLFEV